MRRTFLALSIVISAHDVLAQEPLFLRIRATEAARTGAIGTGTAATDDDLAARARAVREAIWTRSADRAHRAIASICKGCLTPSGGDINGPESQSAALGETTAPAGSDAVSVVRAERQVTP